MKSICSGLVIAFTIIVSSCASNENKTAESGQSVPKPGGAEIYGQYCAACHQSSGEGLQSVYPPLAKSDFLANKEKTILQVIKGSTGEMIVNGAKYNSAMPAQQLGDEEVAAVLTYVYSNFGNSGGTVTGQDVKAVRANAK